MRAAHAVHDAAQVAERHARSRPGSDAAAVSDLSQSRIDQIRAELHIGHAQEDGRHLLTADGPRRTVRAVLIALQDAGTAGPEHGIVIPRTRSNVRKCARSLHGRRTGEPVEHLRDHGAGRRHVRRKLGRGHAVHQAGSLCEIDSRLVPAALRIGEGVGHKDQIRHGLEQVGRGRLDRFRRLRRLVGRIGRLHALDGVFRVRRQVTQQAHILQERPAGLQLFSGRRSHDAVARQGIFLADDALELLRDVFHDHLVQRQAGVELVGRRREGVVGVAAAGHEVVRDDSVGSRRVKRLAVDVVNGHALDALRAVVGGFGIGIRIRVILLIGLEGKLQAGRLREAAEGFRRAESTGLERLEQLGAGHVNNCQRVAERQHGVDVLLGDVARLDGRADAAAVRDGDHVLHRDLDRGVAADLPEHGVRDQVAEVGLGVTVAVGGLRAVERDLADGKLLAIGLVDGVDDGLGGRGDLLIARFVVNDGDVLAFDLLLVPDALELVADDLLRGVVNGDDADVGKSRARGLDVLAVRAGGDHAVGVAVDDEVDALHVLGQVIGGVGLGAAVDAQVGQADDEVCALLLEGFDLRVRAGIELFAVLAREELQALDQLRVGLGLRFGRLETEEADLHAALFDDGVGIENGLAVGAEHVGAQDLELGSLHVLRQLGIAVVELMVADGGHIVAGGIHHRHRVRALVDADVDGALTVVAGVGQDDLGALRLIVCLQGCHGRIQVDRTVHVVRVQDDGLAGERLCLVSCKCRARQTQDQAQHQQQRKQFLRVLHVISSIF